MNDNGKLTYLLKLTFGTLLVTVGVYFFKFPNHFSTGGVSGISVVLGEVLPHMTPGAIQLLLNAALLLIGFRAMGGRFGLATAYASLLMSGVTFVLERVYPMPAPFTSQPLLELVFAVMLPAFGSAILFNMNASTGGTDIVAVLLKKYTRMDIGRALLLTDVLVVVASAAVFGMETGLFSLLGLGMKSLMVDSVIENINLCKFFTIMTEHPDPICRFIVNELNRGATTYDGEGAFTHKKRKIIVTVVTRGQAIRLRQHVKAIDPHAFMLITNTSEIIGKGVRAEN